MIADRPRTRVVWPRVLFSTITGLLVAGSIFYVMFAVSFLSVTKRVDADILVVEGWVSPRMLPAVIDEFHRGHYSLLLVSGMQNVPEADPSEVMGSVRRTLTQLEGLGVPRNQLVPCPAPYAKWYRTAHSAKAVRARIHDLGLKPRGINVITEGIHARKTWVAYEHMFAGETPVGIVAVPEASFFGHKWGDKSWANLGVARDFAGWLREVIFPLRP